MRLVHFAFCFFLLVAWECTAPDLHNDFQPEQATWETRQIIQVYQEGNNQRGMLAKFDYLDNSPNFIWEHPGYYLLYRMIR